jgi:hypothetical protein
VEAIPIVVGCDGRGDVVGCYGKGDSLVHLVLSSVLLLIHTCVLISLHLGEGELRRA